MDIEKNIKLHDKIAKKESTHGEIYNEVEQLRCQLKILTPPMHL